MAESLTGDDFNNLFRYFERTAFRLETRPFYTVSAERESFEEFLTGSPRPLTDFSFYEAWDRQIRRLTAEGKQVRRVRLLDVPPTDYQRWEIWAGTFSARAGEVIRYLDRPRAVEVGLPTTHDWWLFDSERLALMRFDDEGHPLGGEMVTDPIAVDRHRRWQDVAIRHAVDHELATDQ